jgi:hypothetical protein
VDETRKRRVEIVQQNRVFNIVRARRALSACMLF